MKSNIIKFINFLHKNDFIILILQWFNRNQRNLYWRKNRNIYHTYLSEIMLQQTTVPTVENKIQIFLKKFPNFQSFKRKKLEDVMSVWSGLGYYNRAINLFKSIEIINLKYGGTLPKTKIELIGLPGIGKYTANAILAIGFNKKAFPIDVNIKRLISRIIGSNINENDLELLLENLFINKKSYRKFSESMMDYSSSICLKSKPKCSECIFRNFCKSANKTFVSIQSKKNFKDINFYIFKKVNKILFINNPTFNFYKSFLHLPSNLDKEIISKVKKINIQKIKSFNYSITNNLFKVNVFQVRQSINIEGSSWISLNSIKSLPMPTLFKKVLFN